jgi:deoxyguanosine kinase
LPNTFIAIEGPIGVGKSTLARLIQSEFEAGLLMEVFEENPFLSKFYADRAKYAFQTQIFFLLSRYRQQAVVPQMLQSANLVSDYTFSKDRLFAHLNVRDDELEMYERLHGLLAEKVRLPDLVVYLRAETDALMERIAVRDREYERGMDRDYIEALNQAYARFFADYALTPVLPIDTTDLDIVRRPEDLAQIVQRIKSALGQGTHQRSLLDAPPEASAASAAAIFDGQKHGLPDFQIWHRTFDREKGFSTDLFFNFLCLQEEMGELADELTHVWARREALCHDGMAAAQALETAIAEQQSSLRGELADCLAYIVKLANYTGIDLQAAYLDKMQANKGRTWSRLWTRGDPTQDETR